MTAAFASRDTKGGPDWALAFADFHARHRDVKGRKLVFTAVFNAAMEAFIMCPEVPLVWRVLAWIWRLSWGNDSDYCVDDIGGSPMGQQACADHFGVKKQRVHDCVVLLRELNFVLPPDGHKLYPVDDPTRNAPQSDSAENVKSPGPSGLFEEFNSEWKVRDLADFQELESAEATVNRIKIVRLGKYKKWLKGRSNSPQTIKPNIQHSPAVSLVAHPPSSSAFSSMEETPPAGRQASTVEPACLWHGTLRTILAKASPPDVLGDSMFGRIAAHLTEELLPQFKTAVLSATTIRKWSGIEAIAKQVAARGLVAAGNGSGDESLMERAMRIRGISNG
jgi:hypothetical protein